MVVADCAAGGDELVRGRLVDVTCGLQNARLKVRSIRDSSLSTDEASILGIITSTAATSPAGTEPAGKCIAVLAPRPLL